mmetsp:Transcript_79724/g.129238  ORF Transcript_79724/g.129238 Transcript_79724/m.129238 type:complete len:579 (+) Transcript_79724:26-1762(+)|eukprot:CAMPEP_0179462770 /NCGR_PEP_ID=MMETSP0799-20121207/45024_1 /TAXON_ID=46947 /ORGANISM="Geminigera cryophila, Strain CCMP2564" /LENGTH=578 /DNA_ID=CAMNT_0021265761 /DNA_START=26 /DNA_END=1762 /DNA_ORIENTATION=+
MDAAMQALDKFFKITERGSTPWTEFRAGTVTFLTMCYILAVNSRLLSESGGPCECSEETRTDPGCMFYDDGYEECIEKFRRELVTVTALSSFCGCFLMGTFANLPFALAPGMGLNAYFTYDVVGFKGTGNIPWRTAMAAVFIEGIIFFLLTITGLRIKFAQAIPEGIKIATTGGIGFFLAHLGLQTAEGIGLVVTDVATGLTLGACPAANRTYATYGDDIKADAYTCDKWPGSKMTSATTWLGIVTFFIIGVLMKRRIHGAIIIGVLFATFISWIPDTKVSYFSDTVYPIGGQDKVGAGEYRYAYFKQVAKLEPIDMAGGQMDFNWNSGGLAVALFTFLYVDLLDTTGTLFAMAKFANLIDPVTQDFEGSTRAFMVDAISTSLGAVMGTSPVTTYIESAPGIEEGGRTGLTAVVVSFYFLLSIFFAPLLASVPPWATGPALITVGAMMMRGLVDIKWGNYGEAIPAFVTIALMPLTYSIAYGIIGGLFSYVVINGTDYLICRLRGEEYNGQFNKAVEHVEEAPMPKLSTPPIAMAPTMMNYPGMPMQGMPSQQGMMPPMGMYPGQMPMGGNMYGAPMY